MGKGGGGSTQTIQRADPWSGVQPALHELYSSALSNFRGPGPQYYPGQTVAGQSGYTQQAIGRLFDRATNRNPLLGQGQQQASETLGGRYMENFSTKPLQAIGSGEFLNANPYLDEMFGRASSAVGEQFRKNVMPGIASAFSAGGRYGSNAMQEGLGQAEQRYGETLGNLATDIYGQNYARERALQQQALSELGSQFGRERLLQNQAMGAAPGLANADYFDINQLMGLGAQQDAYSQALLDSDINRWNFNQNAPNQELAFLNSILQGGLGLSGSTTSQNYPRNPLAGAVGGALMGSQMLPFLGTSGALGSTAAASGMMGGAGINALGGLGLGSVGLLGGAILGGLLG